MDGKNPLDYSFMTYLWVFLISMLGGVVHNIVKVKKGFVTRFSFSELVGDIVISGFLGIMTFYLCEYAKFDMLLTAFLVGMTSHMGTRGIMLLEEIACRKIRGEKCQDL